jgi:hypothetical protein
VYTLRNAFYPPFLTFYTTYFRYWLDLPAPVTARLMHAGVNIQSKRALTIYTILSILTWAPVGYLSMKVGTAEEQGVGSATGFAFESR